MRWTGTLWAVIGLVGLSCSGGLTRTGALDGRTRVFEDGLPDFEMEAVPATESPEDSLRVHLGLIPATLVFQPARRGYRASFRYELYLNGEPRLEGEDSLVVATIQETRTYTLHQRAYTLGAQTRRPKSKVQVRLEDLSTERVAVRSQPVSPSSVTTAAIWAVQLLESGRPVLSLHFAATLHEVRARTTLITGASGCIEWTLAQIPSDTSVASAPFLLSPSYGSVVYQGAVYAEADTLVRKSIPLEQGSHTPEWILPKMESGVYRVGADWVPGCSGKVAVAVQRDFLVRSESYPQVTRLDQLVEALDYIATPEEMQSIRSAGDGVARKKLFDAFWGRTGGDRIAASDALSRYYSRVEEANRAFSSFKEGWKTDRGMVSIVMGPPLYTEDSIDELRWFYSYDDRDPGKYFVFDRVRGQVQELGLPHYVLNRTMAQEREWRLAVQRWRRGTAR